MGDKKADQKKAIALLSGWGWNNVIPVGRHRVVATLPDMGAITWCVPGILRNSVGGSAQWCPKHNPDA